MQQLNRNFHKNHRFGYCHFYGSVSAVALLLFPICALSQITVSPASGSGVINTGNAAVGDVASGKTFSSSVLTNATGTSTKNATTPNDAPIQPPQVFVDFSLLGSYEGGWDFSNRGITVINSNYNTIYYAIYLAGERGDFVLNFSNNSVSNINDMLSIAAQAENSLHLAGGLACTLILSGAQMGAPTGQGITDKAALITAGWTVTTN